MCHTSVLDFTFKSLLLVNGFTFGTEGYVSTRSVRSDLLIKSRLLLSDPLIDACSLSRYRSSRYLLNSEAVLSISLSICFRLLSSDASAQSESKELRLG